MQRPVSDQILKFEDMLQFCCKHPRNNLLPPLQVWSRTTLELKIRKKIWKCISFAWDKHISSVYPTGRKYCFSQEVQWRWKFLAKTWLAIKSSGIKRSYSVWLCRLHTNGPARSFSWPSKYDNCLVPVTHILCTIDPPATSDGRQYIFSNLKVILTNFDENCIDRYF